MLIGDCLAAELELELGDFLGLRHRFPGSGVGLLAIFGPFCSPFSLCPIGSVCAFGARRALRSVAHVSTDCLGTQLSLLPAFVLPLRFALGGDERRGEILEDLELVR